MDRIILKGLPVGCVIGTLPAERTAPQTLFFDLELCGDFSRAGRTDVHLLERLGYGCGQRLLDEFPLLDHVTLRIRKPDAPVESESVELEVTLARS